MGAWVIDAGSGSAGIGYDASGNLLKPGNQPINAKQKQYPLFLIGSKELGPVALHANLGYLRTPNDAGNHEDLWHASLAAEYEVVKDLKLMADIGASRNPTPGTEPIRPMPWAGSPMPLRRRSGWTAVSGSA